MITYKGIIINFLIFCALIALTYMSADKDAYLVSSLFLLLYSTATAILSRYSYELHQETKQFFEKIQDELNNQKPK